MAPGTKRKRGDRTYSQDGNDGSQRASPHRPQNLSLAQQNQHANGGARGGRRGSRGGLRGGHPGSQQPRSPGTGAHTSQSPSNTVSPTTKTGMSPPPPREPQSQPTVAAPETQTVTPAASTEPKAQSNALPYRWDYVIDERRKSWRESGHNEIVDEAIRLQQTGDDILLGVVFGELVMAVIRERLSGQEVGSTVKEILDKSGTADSTLLPALFLDNLQIIAEVEKSSSPALGVLLRNSGIPASLIREVLDVELLQALGFVRSTFGRMGIRVSTNLLYRQSAFNLLREETEGYSKLITEYFTVTGSLSPTKEVVEETYEKIKALIGAFDLDVGRVLDVTLDAFANSIIRHHRFFIKFLRMSCWWPKDKSIPGFEHADQVFDSLPLWADPDCSGFDITIEDKTRLSDLRKVRDIEFWDRVRDVGIKAFFELGGRRAILSADTSMVDSVDASASEKPGDDGESDQDWTKHTGTYPPRGNSTAAQLLGFKLRFYASQARDAQDTLPETLIWLAALLIKIGFISFRDLYPHLYPLDDDMAKLKDKLLAAKKVRKAKSNVGARPNALQAASALPEGEPSGLPRGVRREAESGSTPRAGAVSGTPANAEATVDKEELPEPDDQKVHLLRNLLLLGAIPEAMYILGRFPWLLDVYEDLPQYIFRILHYSLQKVAEEVRPLPNRDDIRAPKKIVYEGASNILPKGHLFLVDRPNRKTLKYASLEKTEVEDGFPVDFKFYWDDWADNVPVCQNVEDVFTLCGSLLNLVGVKIGADTSLLTKLIRIGRKNLDEDKSEANVTRWVDLCKRLLVPALSLSGKNPGVVGEMWLLLKYFPLSTRYSIYSQWHRGPISRNPDILEAFERSRAETRDVLKRMSRTTIRPMARALAKVCCESPTKVFETAINQIESYSNQVEIFVEVCKYSAPMTYDVLTWSLLEALGSDRSRLQGDGMLTSGWLNALSALCGKAFRTYQNMDPAPILRYIAHQLRRGSSAELEVLIQLIESMAGIRPDTTWTDEQLLAMSGKETLQAQVLKQLGDRRNAVKTPSRRLLRVLITNNLAGPLLIGIAQMRQLYPNLEEVADAPTKVISSNLTKIYDALIQYLDLLRTNLSVDEFDKAIPALAALIQSYQIDPSIAFTVFRPSIQHRMEQWEKANPTSASTDGSSSPSEDRKSKSNQGTEANSGDVEMADNPTDTGDEHTNGAKDAVMNETEPFDASDPGATLSPTTDRALHPILRDLMGDLRDVMPEGFSSSMSLSFYVRFWQSSLYDMIVPPYATELKKVETALARIAADKSRDAINRHKAEKDRLLALKDVLGTEAVQHKKHRVQFESRIKSRGEPAVWFANFPPRMNNLLPAGILQDCIIPRILLSPTDALFTAKFFFFVHKIGTPNFPTLEILDQFFREKQLLGTIYMCTEKEAKSLGVFMNEIFAELRRWHLKEDTYTIEGCGSEKNLPGFVDQYHKDEAKLLEWEEFRQRFTQWHLNAFNAVKSCLDSSEYMHRRNAFQVLKSVFTHFPLVNFHGKKIDAAIDNLINSKSATEDIKTSGASILADIRKRAPTWIPMQMMREVSNLPGSKILTTLMLPQRDPTTGELEKEETPAAATDSATMKSAEANKPILNAKAPEFKPTSMTTYA
jgi:THO complex subunit 2